MEKFHYFPYDKEFTLQTDQKPLVSIYKKHMVDISPRVQRLIVRSFPYLPFHVVYKKGKDIPVADALSVVTPVDPEDNIQLPIITVNMITTHILMSVHPQDTFSKKLDRLRKSTAQDNQLTRLSCYINTGFPCDKKNLPTDLQEFWNNRDTLSIENGLITCSNRIIVPKEMRAEMLQYIHEGHQGKERCLLWARNTAFWSKITCDIQELIEVYHLPRAWKIPIHHWNHSGTSTISMAHIGNRYLLLEENGLSHSHRCILKVFPSEEIG